MMIQNVIVLGRQDLIWKAVVEELMVGGLSVTIQVGKSSRVQLDTRSDNLTCIGDNNKSLEEAFSTVDAVYYNHPNTDTPCKNSDLEDFKMLISYCSQNSIKRFAFLSSTPFVKGDKVISTIQCEFSAVLRASTVPYFILYCSRFFESIFDFKRGTHLMLPNKINNSFYWIAGKDFGKLLCTAFEQSRSVGNREYFIQGPELIHGETVFERFVDAYDGGRVRISKVSLKLAKIFWPFSRKLKDNFESLNSSTYFVEEFRAQSTWKELGRPAISIETFASAIKV